MVSWSSLPGRAKSAVTKAAEILSRNSEQKQSLTKGERKTGNRDLRLASSKAGSRKEGRSETRLNGDLKKLAAHFSSSWAN